MDLTTGAKIGAAMIVVGTVADMAGLFLAEEIGRIGATARRWVFAVGTSSFLIGTSLVIFSPDLISAGICAVVLLLIAALLFGTIIRVSDSREPRHLQAADLRDTPPPAPQQTTPKYPRQPPLIKTTGGDGLIIMTNNSAPHGTPLFDLNSSHSVLADQNVIRDHPPSDIDAGTPQGAFIGLRDAARCVLEANLGNPAGEMAMMENTPEDRLNWFGNWIIGTKKVPFYGKRPPSTKYELVPYDEVNRNHLKACSELWANGSLVSYVDLAVRNTDLQKYWEALIWRDD